MIFFDLDGPILNVSEKYYSAYCKALEEFGAEPISKSEYWACKQEKILDELILNKSGLFDQQKNYQRIRNQLIESWPYMQKDCVWPQMQSLLHELSKQEYLVLVTLRTNRKLLLKQLEALGILDCFEKVLSAPGRGTEKWRIKVALVKENIDHYSEGYHCFIGDTETDILAGRALNMETFGVTYGIRSAQFLKEAKASNIFDQPEDTVQFFKKRFLHGSVR